MRSNSVYGRPVLPTNDPAFAQWQIRLPPFLHYQDGWLGSVDEFLSQVRDGTMPLEHLPLASVVDQYLTYIRMLPLDEAGQWIHTAASLIHHKSRLLLPHDPSTLVGADLREEILSEIAAAQQATRKRKASVTATAQPGLPPATRENLSLLDLFVLLNEVEQSLLADSSYLVPQQSITLRDQLRWLRRWLADKKVTHPTADTLFQSQPSKEARICLFLALLEMEKRGHLALRQNMEFGPIEICPAEE